MIKNIKVTETPRVRPQLSKEIKSLAKGTGYFVKPLCRGKYEIIHLGEVVGKPMVEAEVKAYLKLAARNKVYWQWQDFVPATQRLIPNAPEEAIEVEPAPAPRQHRPRIKAVRVSQPKVNKVQVFKPEPQAKPLTLLEKVKAFIAGLNIKPQYKVTEDNKNVLAYKVTLSSGYGKYFSAKIPTNGHVGEFKTSRAGKATSNFAKWMAEVACCCKIM